MSRITIGQRLLIALLAVVFASCATMSDTVEDNPKAVLGGMGGGAAGGLIAAAAGANPAWIAFSVLAGGLVGGAIGNLIDRVRFGMVVDYLDFYIGKYHWPAFNIADSAITVGIFIFIYHLLFKKMPE